MPKFKFNKKVFLIVVGVFFLIATIELVSVVFIYNNLFGSTKAAEVAESIFTLKNSLPADWEYGTGVDFKSYKVVRLQNPKKFVTVWIEQNPNRDHKTLDQLCHPASGKFDFPWVKDADGDIELAGGTARFIRESYKNYAQERIYAEIVDGGYVEIRMVEPNKLHFDATLAQNLLDSIKAFKEPHFARFTSKLFVASQRLSKQQVIKKDALEVVDVDAKVRTKNCAQDLKQIVGKKPTVDIEPGQVICHSQFKPVTTHAPKTDFVVTVADVFEGSVYDPDSVSEMKAFEITKTVPKDAVRGKDSVVGWISRHGLQQGQIVTARDLSAVMMRGNADDEDKIIDKIISKQVRR